MKPDDDHSDEKSAREPAEAGPGAGYDEVKARAEARKERTAKALRENLMRRKQQGRARRAGAADETDGLPAAKTRDSQD
ncbi:hypothetical protein [Pararhizobium sp.]|uniref:hypothetical protein n=1 Tax=Pararhizobium sp. TaxID=1977563 RepID=UPI00271D11AA|nr:hypothetical protein [Pararhizobium sp.]MDO9416226.1 hypothetical protein [Pararhizobium sp.]